MTEALTKAARFSLPGEVTATSLTLPAETPFEGWQEVGQDLQACERSVMWWLGDWWAFGEHKYGERVKAVADGQSFQTLMDAGWVSRQFETSRRREVLSWSHHREVAALPPDQADALLDQAVADKLSRNDLRRMVRALAGPKGTPPAPVGTFSVILADPPWRYDFSATDSRQIENQYPTMEVEDICALPGNVGIRFADDAVLLLWATAPKLLEALQVVTAWGFQYVTHGVWDKEIVGMGYWFRGQHEPLLVCTRGSFPPPPESARISSVIHSKRGRHSEKPLAVYEWLEASYPDAAKLEMFQRTARAGWTAWGNQVGTRDGPAASAGHPGG